MSNSTIAIENFRKYLQIPSVHPDINYDECITFLEKQAKELSLPVKVYHLFPTKPVLVITLQGQEPNLPSVMLNSHMDVVAVFEEKWSHKPFAAEIDEEGNIYARGAQDMKCVGIQYLEAIRRFKKEGVIFRRTIHVVFVPDEETGGECGMKEFAKSEYFKDLNVGVVLDEGVASEDDNYILFYGENTMWHLRIHCVGEPGHGSMLLDNTAGEKMENFLHKMFDFRQKQKDKIKTNPSLTISDVIKLNLTKIEGGKQVNVVPPEFILTIDNRFPGTVNADEWENTLQQWCKEAGENVWLEFILKQPHFADTKLDDSNIFWAAFKKASDKLNIKINPMVCQATTDMRFLRKLGIPCFGFSPINNTRRMLHRENEYLNAKVFINGIDVYCELIPALANV